MKIQVERLKSLFIGQMMLVVSILCMSESDMGGSIRSVLTGITLILSVLVFVSGNRIMLKMQTSLGGEDTK